MLNNNLKQLGDGHHYFKFILSHALLLFAHYTTDSRVFSYLKDTILFLSIGTEDLLVLSRNTLCLLYTLLPPFIIFALPWLKYQLYLYLSSLFVFLFPSSLGSLLPPHMPLNGKESSCNAGDPVMQEIQV